MKPLILLLWSLAIAPNIHAGIVQGVVLEHLSGRPLARSRIRLQPVPTPGRDDVKPMQMRAGGAGQFVFTGVPEGLYLLIAMREGYFPSAYGQRRPSGRGIPVQIARDSDFFTQLQMWRMGAITGRVLDENGIGISGAPVVAYRARLPLRVAGRGESDDRGVYRIHGLDPGKYWVRTGAFTLEDGSGRLPTFGPESRESIQAKAQIVTLDSDTPDADIRAEAGSLFRLVGDVQCSRLDGLPVTITLSSETGRRTTQIGCRDSYTFEGLAPAVYEVFAEKQGGVESGYVELFVDRDAGPGPVRLMPPPQVEFEIRRAGSTTPADIPITLTGRRHNLSDSETERPIAMPRATLAAGHWELSAQAGPAQYIESIATLRGPSRRRLRVEQPPEWYDIFVEMSLAMQVRILVSDQAGAISGTVTSDGKTVPGAPVFLWPVAEASRRALRGSMQMLSDTEGRYRFDGLPPGDYRLLATFDVTEVDEEAMEEAKALTARAQASQKSTVELPLWVAP